LSIENWKVAGGRRHKIVIQRDGDSREAIGAGAEEGEEAEVAEDLELLADFGADVSVVTPA